MIDLWADDPLPEATEIEQSVEAKETQRKVENLLEAYDWPKVSGREVFLTIEDKTIYVSSQVDLSELEEYRSLSGAKDSTINDTHYYLVPLKPTNSWVLRHLLKDFDITVSDDTKEVLVQKAEYVPAPKATLDANGKSIRLVVPGVHHYQAMLRSIDGSPLASGEYKINITRMMDLQALNNLSELSFPKIEFDKTVAHLTEAPIIGFDGTLASLKEISVSELNVVKANSQSYKAIRNSSKTLAEKMEAFGIKTLYDLLSWLPRRYIDKSKPQDLQDLLVDETATIIGTVHSVGNIPNNMGVSFNIELEGGGMIKVAFWRQDWLKNKFPIGSEVLITGKFTIWNRKPQLNGSSIENAKSAAVLPIVPVYKQSETRGITTAFLVAAVRELFARLGTIHLPEYLERENRIDYTEAYRELHLPSTLEHHRKVLDSLAYYELVMSQILIQEQRENSVGRTGVKHGPRKVQLQKAVIEDLPFQLTSAQKRAFAEMNSKLEDDAPSSVLLNADVGAGKSLVAQLACLRSVESGYQAVLMGPTDILARQLYSTFQSLNARLEKRGLGIRIEYMNGAMKAAEKKKLLKEIESGEVDIVVGTHSLMGKAVKYANLGFVAVDEQQKFGAEQRSRLLSVRSDGKIPDFLMQSATPIPRSTAQVFYGDVDMILLDEKPPGRLPIITEWVEEDPVEVLEQLVNPMWEDISAEARKGNQTFVITPLVQDSGKVDAASVERSFAAMSGKLFPDLSVGFVHGQMKPDEQRATMESFRNKEHHILVASTVVEVGVDIPDATRVVVLSADRLGASSLHQIRGRVGRNSMQAKCYLVSLGRTDNSRTRLQSLVDSNDGFDVAKVDLELRGEGTLFSADQSGSSEMMFASLSRHSHWIEDAKNEALEILASSHRNKALEESREHFAAEGRLV